MQVLHSEQVAAPEGTAEGGFRLIEKSRIAGEPGLAARLAAAKGDAHQDGVLLDLWPAIYHCEASGDHIHVLQDRELLFVTRYVGAPEREIRLLRSLIEHARARGLELGYLDMSNRRKRHIEQECGLLSTPLGVVQTVEDMASFSIEGARMRRLRYLVSRFGREAGCRIVEYTEAERAIDSAIRAVMLAWSREKGVVNKVDAILADMRVGNLLKRYRVFLTYLGETLQNVIVLSPIVGGYITDQEYFLPTMPLGGTEWAYVEIMRLLAAEGCTKFSLGLTWGLFEPPAGFSDEEGWALIRRTQGQLARIFERGAQNHQYKNKYCPAEYPLYLYRTSTSRPQIIKQCMGQFFRSGVAYEEIARQIERDERADEAAPARPAPESARFDATRVDPRDVRLDMISDSWAHLDYPFIRARLRRLHEGLAAEAEGGTDADADALESVLGLRHVVLTTSGRNAERMLFNLLRTKRRCVLQNIPFFSTGHNLSKAGFSSRVVADPRVFDPACGEIFRGGLDTVALERELAAPAADVALVLMELCNNGSGGYPVSLAHIRAVSALCRGRGVPFAMDITRVVRNAELVRRHEPGRAAIALWETVAEIIGQADIVLGSLCKDFGLSAGGVLAARDEAFIARAHRYAEIEGAALDHLQARIVRQALHERDFIEQAVCAQLDLARRVHDALEARHVPVVRPVVGHCILVRADAMAVHASAPRPAESLLRFLHEVHGVRGGVHLSGSEEHGPLGRCIRLAMPLGLNDERLVAHLAAALAPDARETPDPALTFMAGAAPTAARAEVPPVGEVRPPRAARRGAWSDDGIAIIGMSGRYAQADSLPAFWRNLAQGRNCITEIPAARWDWREHFHADPEEALRLQKAYGRWGGFVDDFEKFDPQFFWMAPRRIRFIDPQERLFIEECWKALEDAGHPPAALADPLRERTGVFGGMSKQGFNLYAAQFKGTHPHTSPASMVGRVSHFFDLKGPSVAIDNHCASALVAVHEGCEYLRRGLGDLAIAGGVSLSLHPSSYVQLSLVQMLSRDARSAAFGKGGAGYVPGEGAGVVVLKRLEEAVRDRDPIHAVIRGGAVNHNGRMRYYGQPSQARQQAVVRSALAQARVDPRTISYIEAAASGVESSDAVEMAALTEVFGERAGTEGEYRIGSVKPAIGHCEAVSGMSQLAKTVLALKHAALPPTLVPAELSPQIDFDRLPFRLQTELTPWERVKVDGQGVPRRAGVTALGNGINAHLVVEEFVADADRGHDAPEEDFIFPISAQDPLRLREYVQRWIGYLQDEPSCDLSAVAWTIQVGRQPMPARLAVVASGRADLLASLARWLDGEGSDWRVHQGRARRPLPADEALAAAVERRDLQAIASLWVRGHDQPWAGLHRGRSTRRVGGLPAYPFARERHWIADELAPSA